jgi:hypothetical protein
LEAGIAEGRITRAQASEWREQAVIKQAEQAIQTRIDLIQQRQAITFDLNRYIVAVPDLNDRASDIRQRVDTEFDYILDTQGIDTRVLTPDKRRVYELQAIRAVLGPIENVRTPSRPTPESHMEVAGNQNKPVPKANPDQALLDGLKPDQVAYYRKGIENGQYKDWAEVVAELKWQPPKGPVFRGGR